MNLALWHWHIEISSKCTLRCPRCPRTEVPESLINTELNLDFFTKNFTKEFILNHVDRITFCGDDGDPIYAHDLVKVIKYFKSIKPVSITLITNGSYKNKTWWVELASALDENDEIHFSIDGYNHETNIQYRINSDFKSIMEGIKIVRRYSNCYMFWDLILFKFNENHLDTVTDLAKKLGFDYLQITKSSKFGAIDSRYKNDNLQPSIENVATTRQYEKSSINLSNRRMPDNFTNKVKNLYQNIKIGDEQIVPLCYTGLKGLFINSLGEFYPCCWVANRYQHNDEWLKLGKKFNLHEQNLNEVLDNSFWKTNFYSNQSTCLHKCNKSNPLINYSFDF